LALPLHSEADEVGLSPVSVVSHFVQATPPITLMVHMPHTKRRHAREWMRLPRLPRVTELGLPSGPKRDASQTISTWPLRRRSLPPDAGYIPSFEVRVEISVQAWSRTGRI